MPSPAPRRIRVVGISGSGKTTLASDVARRLGVEHLELDAVFWDADWTFRDVDQARDLVRSFIVENPDGWVVDGNWTTRLGGLLQPPDGADLVVWLDHSRWLVMTRMLRRTVWRGISRKPLWHGNRERPGSWLSRDPEVNILWYAWTAYNDTRDRYRAAVGQPWFVRLAGRRQVRRWLESLPRA